MWQWLNLTKRWRSRMPLPGVESLEDRTVPAILSIDSVSFDAEQFADQASTIAGTPGVGPGIQNEGVYNEAGTAATSALGTLAGGDPGTALALGGTEAQAIAVSWSYRTLVNRDGADFVLAQSAAIDGADPIRVRAHLKSGGYTDFVTKSPDAFVPGSNPSLGEHLTSFDLGADFGLDNGEEVDALELWSLAPTDPEAEGLSAEQITPEVAHVWAVSSDHLTPTELTVTLDVPTIQYSADAQNFDVTITFDSSYSETPATGQVLVGIEGLISPVLVDITNGVATATLTLPAGTGLGAYTVTAQYQGDVHFAAQSLTGTLTVEAASTESSITSIGATPLPGASYATVTVDVTSHGHSVNDGVVEVTAAGVPGSAQGSVINGVATVYLLLPDGVSMHLDFTAQYLGTDSYEASTATGAHDIDATLTSAIVERTEVTYVGDTPMVNVDVRVFSFQGSVDGGTVTITLPGLGGPVTATVSDGKASATIAIPADTPKATYPITVDYQDGETYGPSSGQAEFYLNRFAVSNKLYVDALYLPMPPTGVQVNLFQTVTRLDVGDIEYSANEQTLVVTAQVTNLGDPVTGGTVTFSIPGLAAPVVVDVVDGVATANLTIPAGTLPGTYDVTGQYFGPLESSMATESIEISKAATTAVIFVDGVSDTTVDVSALTLAGVNSIPSGTVTFTIASLGLSIDAEIVDGAASGSFTLPEGTPPGIYEVQVTYAGSDTYAAASDATTFEITEPEIIVKDLTTVEATVSPVAFSETDTSTDVTVTVTSDGQPVTGGTATISIPSLGITVTGDVINGDVILTVPITGGTAAGTYAFTITYSGDETRDGSTLEGSLEITEPEVIEKDSTTTEATVSPVTFSETDTSTDVTVTVTSDGQPVTGGTATISIPSLGITVTGDVINGQVILTVPITGGTAAGTYAFTITYSGDETRDGSTLDGSLEIAEPEVIVKDSATVEATVTPVAYSPSATSTDVTVTVTSDGQPVTGGTATITIASLGITVTGDVIDGEVILTVPIAAGTAAGTYDFTITYSGDETHEGATLDGSLTIAKATPSRSIGDRTIKFSTAPVEATITATVTDDGTPINGGTVTFQVPGVADPVTADVINGEASVTITVPAGTAAGTYQIQGTYSGDDNHLSADVVATLTIQALAPLTIYGTTLNYYVPFNQPIVVPGGAGLMSLASSPDDAPLSLNWEGDPPDGLILAEDGSFTFLPPSDFRGIIHFSYWISDGMNDSPLLQAVFRVGPLARGIGDRTVTEQQPA